MDLFRSSCISESSRTTSFDTSLSRPVSRSITGFKRRLMIPAFALYLARAILLISQVRAVLSFYVSISSKGQNGAESHHLIALGHLRPPNRVQAPRRADHSLKQIMHVDLDDTSR